MPTASQQLPAIAQLPAAGRRATSELPRKVQPSREHPIHQQKVKSYAAVPQDGSRAADSECTSAISAETASAGSRVLHRRQAAALVPRERGHVSPNFERPGCRLFSTSRTRARRRDGVDTMHLHEEANEFKSKSMPAEDNIAESSPTVAEPPYAWSEPVKHADDRPDKAWCTASTSLRRAAGGSLSKPAASAGHQHFVTDAH